MVIRSLFFLLAPMMMVQAQTSSPVTVQLQQVASGLTRITDIAHAGDDRIFCVLQAGSIRIFQNGTVLPTPFLNITGQVNSSGNEQGLLGLAFDPDHASNGYFYVYYINGSGAGTSRVSRFSVSADPNVADPASEVILYTRQQPASNHNGGDLDFGPDGYLYVGFGDGGGAGDTQNNAQNLTNVLGDMIRIDVHGELPYEVPEDNPYVGHATYLPEIWASGLRNPWRFGFDALVGDLWIGDVGQNAYEEVDFWPAGDNSGPNFGWRCYEGNVAYNTSGCQPQSTYDAPVKVHQQSAQGWCSVIGGRVYRGSEFERLYGRYIYTDYCGGQFWSLRPDGSSGWLSEQLLGTSLFGISCIGENNALELYAGNSSAGLLYRIVDPCPMDAPMITQDGDTLTSSDAVSYTWYLNGNLLPDETGQSIEVNITGNYVVQATFVGGCQFVSEPFFAAPMSMMGRSGHSFQVYPVPADRTMTITGLPASGGLVQVLDATGRSVLETRVAGSQGDLQLATSNLVPGQYVVRVLSSMGEEFGRSVVSIMH